MWTRERLTELVRSKLGDRLLVVVSNRQPYVHVFDGDEIKYYVPPGGLVTALEPILEASGGYWVADASGEADSMVVNQANEIGCPPDDPKFTLKRVFLTKEEETRFYYNFANGGRGLCATSPMSVRHSRHLIIRCINQSRKNSRPRSLK